MNYIKVGIAALVLLFLTWFTVPYWTHETTEVVVKSSVVKPDAAEAKYLIFTDGGVYENTDTWYYFKFNSSDVQNTLQTGGTYKISHYGFRIPFLSKYKNITKAERVK